MRAPPTLVILLVMQACAAPPNGARAPSNAEEDGFALLEAGRYQVRGAGWLAELGADGLSAGAGGDLSLRLQAWGRPDQLRMAEALQPSAAPGQSSTRIEFLREGLVEYWQLGPTGLEQGWELQEPPPGTGALSLELALDGALRWELEPGARGARVLDGSGRNWRYAGLRAWDARGAPLDAWMETHPAGLSIRADDSGASYPLTIDPILTLDELALLASDGEADDLFGFAVAGVGDVDGDGFDDLLVGAYGDDDLGSNAGAAYLWLGSVSGTASASESKLSASDGRAESQLGRSLAGVGDVNGDGFDDLLVGAYGDDDLGSNAGAAYLWLGSLSGLVGETKITASDGSAGDYFGQPVAAAGDVNGDGYDDLLVGACWNDDLGSNAGAAYLYLGAASGVDLSSETKLSASDGDAGDYFGCALAGVGDVDGDGYDDLVMGAYGDDDLGSNAGAAYVLLGSANGVDLSSELKIYASDGAAGDYYGRSLAGAGDLNGDAIEDFAVGSHGDDDMGSASGAVYVYHSNASGGLSSMTKISASDGAADDSFGLTLSGGGDMDGDGYDDLLVGAYGDDDMGTDAGATYVFLGSVSGVGAEAEIKQLASDGAADAGFGYAADWAGDVDGDGYDDLLVGAYGAAEPGCAYLLLGACMDLDEDAVCSWEDCDDGNPAVGLGDIRYADEDHDGWGDPASPERDCTGSPDMADNDDDCDDSSATTYPGAAYFESSEVCARDEDGDGYGDQDPPSGVLAGTDCDDGDASINPGALDTCGDGVDSDCDGSGGLDGDDDGDGLTWSEEQELGLDDCNADVDDDGVQDGVEVESGLDPLDADSDDDGLSDGAELILKTDPLDADSDDDELDDGLETDIGTDPLNSDSDGDGFTDGYEVDQGWDPLSADSDNDKLSDGDEVKLGTDPLNADSDGDGLRDGYEVELGSDPLDDDTDDDGLGDAEEVVQGSDPLAADGDGDGLNDAEEGEFGSDPNDPDSDDDGLDDGQELEALTDPWDYDSDDDGLDDAAEVALGTDPNKFDSDEDGLGDGEEVNLGTDPLAADSDDDGLNDSTEVGLGTDPLNEDTDGDGIGDAEEVRQDSDPLDANDPSSGEGSGRGCQGCSAAADEAGLLWLLLPLAGVLARRRSKTGRTSGG